MPVQKNRPEDHPDIDPYRRLSASQAIAYSRCPRLWYYGWERRLKTPLPPQIIRGNAAEACICRVMRDSPVFVSGEGKMRCNPRWTNREAPCGAPKRGGLPLHGGPGTVPMANRLRDTSSWAHSRKGALREVLGGGHLRLDGESQSERNNRRRRSRGVPEHGAQGVDLHLIEVQGCLDTGQDDLEAWRDGGSRPYWPAPDGFPASGTNPTPQPEGLARRCT